MPYALVETMDTAGVAKLLTVPEGWIAAISEGVEHLLWPDPKSVRNINTLLADDRSSPTALWEKHECNVIYRDIASLTVAKQTRQIIETHRQAKKSSSTGKVIIEVGKTTSPLRPKVLQPVEANQPSGKCVQASSDRAGSIEQDPFRGVSLAAPTLSDTNTDLPNDSLNDQMPYAIVETEDAAGTKKMMVVPEPWVECKLGEGEYLHWPDAKSIKTLKELMADEQSCPTDTWETRECKIICQQVPSLESGEKTVEIIQSSLTTGTSSKTTSTSRILSDALTKPKAANVKKMVSSSNNAPTSEMLIVVEETRQSENIQDLLCDMIPKEEEEDPFEDLERASVLLKMETDDLPNDEIGTVATETNVQRNDQNMLSLIGIEAMVMPYAIVETEDAAGTKKMVVVPEPWLECKFQQGEYLRWPDAKSIKNLKELMADEKSRPTAAWQTRECKIICQQVPSLESGEKTVEILQSSLTAATSSEIANINRNFSDALTKTKVSKTEKGQNLKASETKKKGPSPSNTPTKETLIVVEETQPGENIQDPLCVMFPKKEEEDPFEDLERASVLLKMETDDLPNDEIGTVATETNASRQWCTIHSKR
uniref:Uncharacterized protein n=1 Tax=Anopheles epiroticus TaxID=199890 RepID=A0A182P5B4_9DIPT